MALKHLMPACQSLTTYRSDIKHQRKHVRKHEDFIAHSNTVVQSLMSQTKILLEYCLKQLILDAGPHKDQPVLVRAHKDWPILVSIYFLPQIGEFNSHVM